ncbi:MAG TPA: dodecin [Phycisphaerales bacterium]|nr:dodecin [Phycisphaerales bacterium]
MSDHVYKVIEVVGSSAESSDAAARRAIEVAAETVKNMRWCEVVETRGHIEGQRIAHWQVKVRIGFTLERSM